MHALPPPGTLYMPLYKTSVVKGGRTRSFYFVKDGDECIYFDKKGHKKRGRSVSQSEVRMKTFSDIAATPAKPQLVDAHVGTDSVIPEDPFSTRVDIPTDIFESDNFFSDVFTAF